MFNVNSADLDWLTITTFNPILSETIMHWLDKQGGKIQKDGRWLQYSGKHTHTRKGSVFFGSGFQGNGSNVRMHHACWASGQMALPLWVATQQYTTRSLARVTRLDLQLTVDYPRETWQQTELESALRAAEPKRVISYIESASGPAGTKLATVYYGSRKSDRIIRMYEKPGMGEEVFFRFEVEFKAGRAEAVSKALLDGATPSQILKAEILRLPDVYGLHALLLPQLGERPALPVRTISPQSNTERWLVEQVLPSLDRLLNDHNANHERVSALFRRVLDDYDNRTLGRESAHS